MRAVTAADRAFYAEYDAKGWPSVDPRSPRYCYQPCDFGLHVCDRHPDGMNCMTALNMSVRNAAEARDLFARAKAECACAEGEPDDLIVDLMIGGDCDEDFQMTRQMLARLETLAKEPA